MLTAQQQEALKRIAWAAILSEKETGCPAELSASQAIFESAWLSRAPENNCFGIKSDAHGSGVQYILTHEFLNGQWHEMPLAFEKYDSLTDCFADHARLLQGGVYAAAWMEYQSDRDLDKYITGISKHYATDPNYAAMIAGEAHSQSVSTALAAARESS